MNKEKTDHQDNLNNLASKAGESQGMEKKRILDKLFQILATYDQSHIVAVRQDIATLARIGLGQFNSLLKEVQDRLKKKDSTSIPGESIYTIQDNEIYENKYKNGEFVLTKLANFSAEIVEQISIDDGENTEILFKIRGKDSKGNPYPFAEVQASEFEKLNWIPKIWGASAVRTSGYGHKDKIREAIQLLSESIKYSTRYIHTGWREIDGKRVYLTNSGALDMEGITVELHPDMMNYSLPLDKRNIDEARLILLELLEIGSPEVFYALISFFFLSPLGEYLKTQFTLWLYGETGTKKSTLAALFSCFFGKDFHAANLPADWAGTENSLEKKLFLLKNAVLTIDDYHPEADYYRKNHQESKADSLVRSTFNRMGRSRLDINLNLVETFKPRSFLLSTGEEMPPGQSLRARCIIIELTSKDVDDKKLKAVQNKKELLSYVMADYLRCIMYKWDWDNLISELEMKREKFHQEFMTMDLHPSLSWNAANLSVGLYVVNKYLKENDVISKDNKDMFEKGYDGIKDIVSRQSDRMQTIEPILTYFTRLAILVYQRKVGFVPLPGTKDRTWSEDPTNNRNIENVGAYDDEHFYIIPDPAFQAVENFSRRGRTSFPIDEETLRTYLDHNGLLVKDKKEDKSEKEAEEKGGRLTVRKTINGKSMRVLKIKRAIFEEYIGIDRSRSK